jgi:anthranilate synthase component 2
VVAKDSIPDSLVVTAVDDSGEVMALRHRTFSVCGVQFHPESILTETGRTMLENWISYERAA